MCDKIDFNRDKVKLDVYSDDFSVYLLDSSGLNEGYILVTQFEIQWIVKTLKEFDKVQDFIKELLREG